MFFCFLDFSKRSLFQLVLWDPRNKCLEGAASNPVRARFLHILSLLHIEIFVNSFSFFQRSNLENPLSVTWAPFSISVLVFSQSVSAFVFSLNWISALIGCYLNQSTSKFLANQLKSLNESGVPIRKSRSARLCILDLPAMLVSPPGIRAETSLKYCFCFSSTFSCWKDSSFDI